MKIVSITLARGGSKGISRKNMVLIDEKPLVFYAVNNSLVSSVDETWVSTDDEEIAKACKGFGANVIMRPKEISKDTSKCEDALLHFAEHVEFDVLAFIQATSPLLEVEYLERGLEMMREKRYDSVFSVQKEHWIPRWSLELVPLAWNPSKRPRRQMMPETYLENGAFYLTTRAQLLSSGVRYGGNMGVVEMPLAQSLQVDTEDDLELIRKLIGRSE
jgi:CMP-N-acetylneuraminic acid synthetase